MPSVDYLIATFFGKRRCWSSSFKNDPLTYLKRHLKTLVNLKHNNIRNIVVIIACDEGGSKEAELTRKSVGPDVKITTRENLGLSYGSWLWYHKNISNPPDYYILMEDDYIPMLDNFDDKLINIADSKQADYVCGEVTILHSRRLNKVRSIARPLLGKVRRAVGGHYATMPCGLITSEMMHRLDYEELSEDWKIQQKRSVPQLMFNVYITLNSGKVVDILDHYSFKRRHYGSTISVIGDPMKRCFYMPLL